MSGSRQKKCHNAGWEYVGPVLEADSGMKIKKRNSSYRITVQDFIKATARPAVRRR